MEEQLGYGEWFFQSGRTVYCVFMCHLSVEKALKGQCVKRLNQFPPKLHDLMYFLEKLELELENAQIDFMMWLNRMGITTRYPEDLRNMIKLFS